MAEHNALYRQAVHYDIALRRDVSAETRFIADVHRRLRGRAPGTVLDIACGPGYHARALALEGIAATGLDLRPEMLRFAADQASAEGAPVEWLAADMREFRLKSPVDMAICMFDGIDCLLENDDIVRHLKAVAANLVPGGLYLVECTHPRDNSLGGYGAFRYTGERDGTAVDLRWATSPPVLDPVRGVARVEVELRVRQNGREEVLKDVAAERLVMHPQELQLLADRSGAWGGITWYGDFRLDQPLDNTPASRRMIAVLRRVDEIS